ncbi:MAG: DUF2339 domain-containing protein [Gammaproteobacteria bacterium]|nr:DUF2339 domain-containing protein [Gammaproteobacteria bacterium]
MSDKAIIFAVIGVVVGLLVSVERLVFGAVLGALSGYLLATVYLLQQTVRELSQTLEQYRSTAKSNPIESVTPAPSSDSKPVTVPQPAVEAEPNNLAQAVQSQSEPRFSLDVAKEKEDKWKAPAQVQTPSPLLEFIKHFFTDGNAMVRIGLLVLFVGVGFLLKYAAENSLFPIELRLAGVFLLGIGLMIIGWRLRNRRHGFALLLQGGAIGVMYLTIFAAAKLYDLFPLPLALVVLITLVMASSLLAVIQNSKALAMFAAAGGFLAPVLTSTGSGDHVILFTYYLFLNAGILFIAWHKAWRELNLEAYLFTLVIGSLWGASAYGPQHFATTEPFLLSFFVMFVAISVLFAWRTAPKLKDYVDGSLVFGVPVTVFALQALMLSDSEYGLSFSALGFGAFYVTLATVLWRRQRDKLRQLTEGFLAIGVAFLTLAIPFALDGRITAAAWALEGAGLVWIGVKQGRRLPLASGVLLQFVSAIFFYSEPIYLRPEAIPFLHAVYIGAVLIAISAFFSAWYLERHPEKRSVADIRIDLLLFIWGGVWWVGSGLHEIFHFHGLWRMNELLSMILLLTISGLLLHLIDRRFRWPMAVASLSYHIPVLATISLLLPLDQNGNVLSDLGYLVLPLAAIVHYFLLKQREQGMSAGMLTVQHSFLTWWLLYLVCWQSYWLLTNLAALNEAWGYLAWGLIPALFAVTILRLLKRVSWPFMAHAELYSSKVVSPLFLFTWIWILFAAAEVGDPAPLPYIPVLNPVELASLLLMLLGAGWLIDLKKQAITKLILFTPRQLAVALAVTGFVWLNSVLARSVHYFGATEYQLDSLFNSTAFQMAIAITWTLLALSMTYLAHRIGQRRLWIVGAVLLAIVVAKLIFIDLANSGTIERIISFISVGLLMLLTGYLSPLPPQKKSEATT